MTISNRLQPSDEEKILPKVRSITWIITTHKRVFRDHHGINREMIGMKSDPHRSNASTDHQRTAFDQVEGLLDLY